MSQLALYDRNRLSLRPLRPKQAIALEQVRQAVREGHKRIVLQAPTGMGKTLMAAHLIGSSIERGKRPLFTCPAITLVDQTLKAFEREGIHDIGVIQANHYRTDWDAQVQIASVQTLIRRPLPQIDFAIIDEVHLIWKELNKRLDSPEWADKIVIGLSATPWTKGLGLRWTKLIVAATIDELIDDGHLSPFIVYQPDCPLDRRKVKVEKGQFAEESASEAMRDCKVIGDVVKEWMEKGPGEKTFMFCVNRAHAQAQMQAFIDAGIPCGYIDGETPMEERKRVFAQLQSREIALIASVGCLIQGVDEDVRCISDCQPTRSTMRHVQKLGRGLRTADGKAHVVILDHAGNTMDLGLPNEILYDELDKSKPKDKQAERDDKKPPKPKLCPKCHALVPASKAVCPNCGERFKTQNKVQHQEGGLKLARDRKTHRDEKQEFYSGLLHIAKEREFKEGWAAQSYRERFGVWPNGLTVMAKTPSRAVRDFDYKRRVAYLRSKRNSREVIQ